MLSPSLSKTAFTQTRELAAILIQLLTTVDSGLDLEAGKPEQLLAEMLVRQGYLRSGAMVPEPRSHYEIISQGEAQWIVWSAFEFSAFRRVEKQLEDLGSESIVHLLLGDGDGMAWSYARQAGQHPCIECALRRWLAHKNPEVCELGLPGRHVRWKPAAEASRMLQQKLEWGSVRVHGESATVPILATPQCSDCVGLESRLRPKARNHALRASHFGLLETLPRAPALEHFHFCRAWVPGRSWLTRQPGVESDRGAGCSSAAARERAIKKGLERYCASFCDPRSLESRPLHEDDRVLVPVLYNSQQAVASVSVGQTYDFIEVCSWGGGPAGQVLKEQVLFQEPGLPRQADGLEGAETASLALENGLLELFERDATALVWGRLNRGDAAAGFRALVPEGFRKQLQELQLEPFVLQIPSLGGVTYVVIVEDASGRLAFGSACRLVAPHALEKALTESLDKYDALSQYPLPAYDCVPSNSEEHRRYYWDFPQRFPWAAVRRLPEAHLQRPKFRDLGGLLRDLESKGHRVVYRDLTTPDVRQLGYTVLRVLAPQWLYAPADHLAWPLGLERWKRLIGAEPPPTPHPFG